VNFYWTATEKQLNENVSQYSNAKVFCSEAAGQATSMAMQIMAGRGYVSGNPVEWAYRKERYAVIAGTTSEVTRMAITDDLLKQYRV
jgi:alkylation response protein AidB-like acyl-CoA dehydrogenase